MLVSHRYGFIYTKTAKTAGTSVESFFERFCMPDGTWTQLHAREQHVSECGVVGYRGAVVPAGTAWWNHMSASVIKARVGPTIWDAYFKFCVVRNPFDKCISAFYDLGRDYVADPRLIDELRREGLRTEQIRFIGFLQQHPPVDRDAYLLDGKFCLDAVIRYEALEHDIRATCKRVGVPFERKYLPGFKRGIRPRKASVSSLFTERSRELVERAFAFELDFFGYRFPDGAG